ncbi:MAG: RHS repeat-associated core domain-containing protein, partial [Chthonomonadales bacterium]
ALGRTIASQNALGYFTTMNYDVAGRQASRLDATGAYFTTIFDAVGRASAYLNPNGNLFSFSYNGAGQQAVTVNPLNQRQTYAFDARGQAWTDTDPKGQILTRSYTARMQESGLAYADGTLVTNTYDARGMTTVIQDSSGILTRSYDALGRVSVWNGPGHQSGQPLTNTYDAVGNRTKLETWWGPVSWSYDARNANATVADPGFAPISIPGGITTWTYDPRGMVSRQDNCDATHTTLTYDGNGQPLQIEHLTNASAQIDRAWYAYDQAGRPTSKRTADGFSNYGYDHADRLTSENNPVAGLLTWTYDAAGRRGTAQSSTGISTYSYDIADGLQTVTAPAGITSYSYDANGNTALIQAPTGSPTSYTWDPANRMTQAKLPNGDVHTNTLRYDNMRTKHVSPTGTEYFLWDSDGLPGLLGVIGKGAVASHLAIHGPNMSRMVGRYVEGGGAMVAQFHLDRQDSVLAITRLAGGSPVTDIRYKMDAFGVVYSGAIAGNHYIYVGGQGYWTDTDLNLQVVRNRELKNDLGRWLSRDPIGFVGGDWNLWGYVGNESTRFVDPTGHRKWIADINCSGVDKQGVKDATHVVNALDAICSAWEKTYDPRSDTPPGEQQQTLVDRCLVTHCDSGSSFLKPKDCIESFCLGTRKIVIDCHREIGLWDPCANTNGPKCANTNGDTIDICAPSLPSRGAIAKWCGPLSCVLLHEIVHTCNINHPEGGVGNQNRSQQEDCYCFNCIINVIGTCDGYWVNTKTNVRSGWNKCCNQ